MPGNSGSQKRISKKPFWSISISQISLFLAVLVLAIALLVFLSRGLDQYSRTGQLKRSVNDEKPVPAETKAPDLTLWNYCQKESAYPLEPRFQRALSLLLERSSLDNQTAKTLALRLYLVPIAPCLDIQYCNSSQMLGADGLFFFSSEMATRERLPICVSRDYQQEDDLLTALLLAHEASHAIQYVFDQTGTSFGELYKNTCYGREAMAFTEQTLFLISLTEGEGESLLSRVVAGSFSPRISTVRDLINISGQMSILCEGKSKPSQFYQNEFFICLIENLEKYFREAVQKDPFYQRQCSQ